MADVTITPTDNGPYVVKGQFKVIDGAGNEFEVKETALLCRCGQSGNKPGLLPNTVFRELRARMEWGSDRMGLPDDQEKD